ncbi:GlxA family transcriptional regulator, partial [Rhizobium sp. BR5]
MTGVAGSALEVGLVLYRDCQIAMVHGITDLFAIASVFSQDRGGPKLRVSHWSMA